jgi:UDP-N-acetylmuramate-alanine ligase
MRGYDATHLSPRPDLVVVGNVCRKDNPEARAAIDGGIAYVSMPGALEQLFLSERPSFVVAGTHGKTTTTALVSFLLREAGREPGYLIGGVPRDDGESFALGDPAAPFVIEGDEYDSAFFEKQPKFFRYRPKAAIITSLEHDHIDIYPSMAAYRAAFAGFVERIPEAGLLVLYAGDPELRALAKQARCNVRFYALPPRLPKAKRSRSTCSSGAALVAACARHSQVCTTCATRWPRSRCALREPRCPSLRSRVRFQAFAACAGGKNWRQSRLACRCTTTSRTIQRRCARRSRGCARVIPRGA